MVFHRCALIRFLVYGKCNIFMNSTCCMRRVLISSTVVNLSMCNMLMLLVIVKLLRQTLILENYYFALYFKASEIVINLQNSIHLVLNCIKKNYDWIRMKLQTKHKVYDPSERRKRIKFLINTIFFEDNDEMSVLLTFQTLSLFLCIFIINQQKK